VRPLRYAQQREWRVCAADQLAGFNGSWSGQIELSESRAVTQPSGLRRDSCIGSHRTAGRPLIDQNKQAMEGELHNKAKLWALMLIDADFDDAGLSLAARGVYVHLCRRADKTHVAWLGIDSIADTVRANKKTVIAAIRELEERGFLRVVRAWGSRSNYEILPKHCWKALPETDQSKTGTGPQEPPVARTDESLHRTSPKEEPVAKTDGTSPKKVTPPVRLRERKDNHIRITRKNDDNARARESEATEASSSFCSLSVLPGKEEPAAASLGDCMASETAKDTRGAMADMGEVKVDALNVLAVELAEEFRLTDRQLQSVAEYCESHGEDYVVCKAEIVRSAPRKNAAGALLAALRDDWQPAVVTGGRANKVARLAISRAMAERMGWEW
jgi:hypothetical protein